MAPPSIAEELNQRKFRSVHHQLALNILFTSGWISGQHARIFKKYGLTMQQYNVLRILNGSFPEPLGLGAIQSRMIDRMSDTSRIVERLRKSGLLERYSGEQDRRTVRILITNKGKDLLEEMKKEEKKMDKIFQTLSEQEAEELNRLLDKLRS
jgi:DNA-binding MarR family transcriptional regulator